MYSGGRARSRTLVVCSACGVVQLCVLCYSGAVLCLVCACASVLCLRAQYCLYLVIIIYLFILINKLLNLTKYFSLSG